MEQNVQRIFLSAAHCCIMQGMLEAHYTAPELAKLWKLSPGVVRAMFENEPDVLTIKRPETRYKRGYTTYKIPESVVRRVYARHLTKRTGS